MKNLIKIVTALALVFGIFAGSVGLQAFAATHTLQYVETPAIALYSSESSTASTMVVTPVPVDLDGVVLTMASFGSTPTLTVDPGINGAEEIESFTGITNNGNNTATISGLTRDLKSQYPYTAGSTGTSHGAGATVVFSNNPQLYNRLASWENDGTVSGSWTYSTLPTFTTAPFNTTDGVNKAYVDQFAGTGCSNANFTTRGCIQIATQIQSASSTVSGSTGANLVLSSQYATSSPYTAGIWTVETRNDGKISPLFIATTTADNYNWGGQSTFASSTFLSTATTTLAGTTTIAASASNKLVLNTIPYVAPSTQGTSGSFIQNDGTGILSWTASTPKYTLISANSTSATGPTLFATSTDSITIPSGVLSASSTITITGNESCSGGGTGSPHCVFLLRTSTGVTLATCDMQFSQGQSFSGTLNMLVGNQSSASSQKYISQCAMVGPGSSVPEVATGSSGSSAVNTASTLQLFMVVNDVPNGGSAVTVTLSSFSVVVTP